MTASSVRCWACGGGLTGPARALAPAPLVKCRECGFAFSPNPDPEDLRQIYDGAYFAGYAGEGYDEAAQRRHETSLRLSWMDEWAQPPGRLLEVGVAAGYFLEGAAAASWQVVDVEPVPQVAAAARELTGAPVHTGFLEDVELPGSTFDVACGWHVLEHIPRPADALEQLRRALVPGGLLFLEVPNAQSTIARLRGSRWPLLGLPGHVCQFGRRR